MVLRNLRSNIVYLRYVSVSKGGHISSDAILRLSDQLKTWFCVFWVHFLNFILWVLDLFNYVGLLHLKLEPYCRTYAGSSDALCPLVHTFWWTTAHFDILHQIVTVECSNTFIVHSVLSCLNNQSLFLTGWKSKKQSLTKKIDLIL